MLSTTVVQVYFYWVCRDKKEFSWFSWLINGLQVRSGVRTIL